MKNFSALLFFFGILSSLAKAQEINLAFINASLTDSAKAENVYAQLVSQHRIPFTENDSVVFFYKGNAEQVSWMGDFNGWGRDFKLNTSGKKITRTNIWYWKAQFPKNARLDYKIVINSNNGRALAVARPILKFGCQTIYPIRFFLNP
jgi:hypothetical protein